MTLGCHPASPFVTIHFEEKRIMVNRKWGAAALVVVLLGVLAMTQSGTIRVGAYQDVDPSRVAEKPKPSAKQTPAARKAEEEALHETGKAFSEAFNKGDLDKLVSFWTADAEFIRESGKTYRGRDAIRSLLKASLAGNKGNKQSIKATSLRFVKPDVVSTEGLVTITTPEGEVDSGRFAALWVKQGDKWLISSIRDLPDTTDEDNPEAVTRLKQLAWLVGEWQERNTKGRVTMSVRWGPNQTFLIQRYTVKQADGKEVQTTVFIGWDAREAKIRSWLFASSGGFGGSYLTRNGNSWEELSEGTTADGQVTTSVNTWKFVDENTAEWTSKEREVDDAPLPDLRVVFVRKDKTR
jgi:uncharacterized protein (TIGR02246 family)